MILDQIENKFQEKKVQQKIENINSYHSVTPILQDIPKNYRQKWEPSSRVKFINKLLHMNMKVKIQTF